MDITLTEYGYSRALWLPQHDMWVSPDERIVSGEEALAEVRDLVGDDEDEEPR
jgi:hypothetical protein